MVDDAVGLKQKAVVGTKWVSFSSITVAIMQFLKVAALTRLLQKDDFGLFGIITVIIGLVITISDMGLSNAIIQRKNATDRELSSLYWLNISAGFFLMFLLWAAAPLIMKFYNEPRLMNLIILASMIFPITNIGQQSLVLMQKELLFKKLSIIDVIACFLGTAVTIYLAFVGMGVTSIITGQLAAALIKSLMLIKIGFKHWKPMFHFSKKDLKGYISFGLFQIGENSINYLAGNMDYILISKFLGPATLGLYTLAYELVLMPLSRINPILTRVAFPVFSKKQDDNKKLCKGYLHLNKIIAAITLPLLTGLLVTSPVAIPVLFGDKWHDAIYLVQILSVLGIFKSLCNPVGTIQLAKGRADIGFWWNIAVLSINTVVFWFFVKRGVYALAISYTILSLLHYITGIIILKCLVDLKIKDYFYSFRGQILISLFMGFCLYFLYLLVALSTAPYIIMLIILILTGMLIYVSVSIFLEKSFCKDIWKVLYSK